MLCLTFSVQIKYLVDMFVPKTHPIFLCLDASENISFLEFNLFWSEKQNILYSCISCFVVIFLQHANGDNAWIGIDGNTGEITDMREIGVCSW